MAETCIISQSGSAITVYHNQYCLVFKNNPIGGHWCFSLNVERYRYKTQQPLIRYNAEIVAKRIDYSPPNPSEIGEEIVIYRSHRRGLEVFGEAHTLLQSLLQAIDNGDPVWDVRELI